MTAPVSGVSCIVYDLDGTLIDSAADIAAAVNRVREHYALPHLEEPIIRTFIGDGAPKLLERAVFGLVDDPTLRNRRFLPRSGAGIEEVVDRFMSIYAEDPVVSTALNDGVELALRYWRKQGVAQAVISNKPHTISMDILERLEVASLFDLIIGRGARDDDGEVLPPKPETALIDYILEQTGAPREETWVVGDGLPDIALARAASIPCVVILGGYTTAQRLIENCGNLDLAVTTFKEADALLRGKASAASGSVS